MVDGVVGNNGEAGTIVLLNVNHVDHPQTLTRLEFVTEIVTTRDLRVMGVYALDQSIVLNQNHVTQNTALVSLNCIYV